MTDHTYHADNNAHMQNAENPVHTPPARSSETVSSALVAQYKLRKEFAKQNRVAGLYAAAMHAPYEPAFGNVTIQVYPQRTFYVRPPPPKRKSRVTDDMSPKEKKETIKKEKEEEDQRKIVKGFGDSIKKEFNLGQRDGNSAKLYDYLIRKNITKEPPLFYGYKNTSTTKSDYIDIAAPPDELWGLYAIDLSKIPEGHVLHVRPGWCWGFSEGVKLDFSYAENFLTANHFLKGMSPLWETFSGDGMVLLRAPTALRVFHPHEGEAPKFDRDDIFSYTTPKLGVSFVVDPRTPSGLFTNAVQLLRGEDILTINTPGPGEIVESRGIAKFLAPVDKEKEEAALLAKLEKRQKASQPKP